MKRYTNFSYFVYRRIIERAIAKILKKKNSLILPWTIIEQWIETISPRYGRKKEAALQRSQKSPSDSSNRGWTIRFWNSAKWKWIHINQRDRWNLGQVHRGQELYADRGRSKVKRENPLKARKVAPRRNLSLVPDRQRLSSRSCCFNNF